MGSYDFLFGLKRKKKLPSFFILFKIRDICFYLQIFLKRMDLSFNIFYDLSNFQYHFWYCYSRKYNLQPIKFFLRHFQYQTFHGLKRWKNKIYFLKSTRYSKFLLKYTNCRIIYIIKFSLEQEFEQELKKECKIYSKEKKVMKTIYLSVRLLALYSAIAYPPFSRDTQWFISTRSITVKSKKYIASSF